MKLLLRTAIYTICLASVLSAAELPTVRSQNGLGQLIAHGKPFLILGGELGNSSAGTAAQADSILPALAKMHINTVLMPVAWDEVEPEEGHFDFSILDHCIAVARQRQLHLVLLWFGSWKNAFSNYAPRWVRADTRRFPRAISADGLPTEILSTLGEETLRCDARAFSALMRHLRETDAEQQTVLMVQVENEMGIWDADETVPAPQQRFSKLACRRSLSVGSKNGAQMSPELAAHFNSAGRTWKEIFGEAADEVFMTWHYALFVNQVAQQGKKEYALPMYANAQLPSPFERAGEYPSGGPHPYYQVVYRLGAPSIDFYAPDIYWRNFEYWVQRYQMAGNPAFVPEARVDSSPYNAFYLYGEARGFGFSPFGVESIRQPEAGHEPQQLTLAAVYKTLGELSGEILTAQEKKRIRGLVLHASSLRPAQTVSLGGYLFQASLARSWPARNLLSDDGAMMVLETKPDEFYVAGSGLTVDFFRDPDVDYRLAGIAKVEQISKSGGGWVTDRELTGDQTNQGRQLLMPAHELQVYRIKLYCYNRTGVK